MTTDDRRNRASRLAGEALQAGEPLAWFDSFYRDAAGDSNQIPWADRRPNVNLVSWLEANPFETTTKTALVVGCGLGDDAELIARGGLETTAFDLSPKAIEWCQSRHRSSKVNYLRADVLEAPLIWKQAFDFVFEAYTLQVMPTELRPAAVTAIAGCVAPGGRLLVISRGRDAQEDVSGFPWPLVRQEIESFTNAGLSLVSLEDYRDDESPPVRRFRAVFRSDPR